MKRADVCILAGQTASQPAMSGLSVALVCTIISGSAKIDVWDSGPYNNIKDYFIIQSNVNQKYSIYTKSMSLQPESGLYNANMLMF